MSNTANVNRSSMSCARRNLTTARVVTESASPRNAGTGGLTKGLPWKLSPVVVSTLVVLLSLAVAAVSQPAIAQIDSTEILNPSIEGDIREGNFDDLEYTVHTGTTNRTVRLVVGGTATPEVDYTVENYISDENTPRVPYDDTGEYYQFEAPGGEGLKLVRFRVSGDDIKEVGGNETIVVTMYQVVSTGAEEVLHPVTGGTALEIEIIDANDELLVSFKGADGVTYEPIEGDNLTFIVHLTSQAGSNTRTSSAPIMVPYRIVPEGTTSVTDFDVSSEQGMVEIPAGDTEASVTIPVRADNSNETSETFRIELGVDPTPGDAVDRATEGATVGGTTLRSILRGRILDAERRVTVDRPQAGEGSDLVFTVELIPESDEDIVLNYTITGGTGQGEATEGVDYNLPVVPHTITFRAGETEATVPVPTIRDMTSIPEAREETLTLTLSCDGGSSTCRTSSTFPVRDLDLMEASGVGTIVNRTETPTLELNLENGRVVEGNSEDQINVAGDLVFNVSISPPPSETVLVPVTFGGSATFGGIHARGEPLEAEIDYHVVCQSPPCMDGVIQSEDGSHYLRFQPINADRNKQIRLNLVNDDFLEDDETVVVTLGTPTDARGGTENDPALLGANDSRTGTILNDDHAEVELRLSATEMSEDGGEVTVTARVTNNTVFFTDETVELAFGGDAVNGDHYNAGTEPYHLTLPANSPLATSDALTISAIDNDVDEDADRTVEISAVFDPDGSSTNVAGSPQTLTITDDDTAMLSLTFSPTEISETDDSATSEVNETVATLTVGISNGVRFSTDQTINLSIAADSTATIVDDFVITGAGSGPNYSLILKGDTLNAVVTATITAVPDRLIEMGGETVVIEASHVERDRDLGGATLNITDDDVAELRYTLTEQINENGGVGELTVEITNLAEFQTEQTFELEYLDSSTAIVDTGQQGDHDFTVTGLVSGTNNLLLLPAGAKVATATITPIDDNLDEGASETAVIRVTHVQSGNAQVGDDQTLIIEDDDMADLRFTLVTTTVTDDGVDAIHESGDRTVEGGSAQLTISIANSVRFPGPQYFKLTFGGTAEIVTDYALDPSPGILARIGMESAYQLALIRLGESTSAVLSAIDDEIDEGPLETIEVTMIRLDGDGGSEVGTAMGPLSIAIIDDDDTVVSVRPASEIVDSEVTEASPVIFTLERAGDTVSPLEVNIGVNADSGTLVEDTLNIMTAQFPANEATYDLSLATIDDMVDEDDDEVRIVILAGDGYRPSTESSTSITVLDDDVRVASVTGGGAVDEGDTMTFTVELSNTASAGRDTVITYTFGGIAEEVVDYTDLNTATPGRLTFGPDETSKDIRLALVEDDIDEVDETIQVTIDVASGTPIDRSIVNSAQNSATRTITDTNLPTVSVAVADSISGGMVNEGEDVVFTLTREGLTTDALLVTIEIDTPDDTLDGAPPTTATFEAGDYEVDVTVATANDNVDEMDATVAIRVVDGAEGTYLAGTDSTSSVLVVDDETSIIMVSTASATEGGDLTFTVTVDPVNAADLELTYVLSNTDTGTGITEDDFNDPDLTVSGTGDITGTLPIPAKTGSISIVITTADDDIDELDVEVVELTYAGAASGETTGTIMDNDTPVVTVTNADTVVEGGDLVFEVSVAPVSIVDLTINYVVSGTGVELADFNDDDLSDSDPANDSETIVGMLTIDAGESTSSIVLTTVASDGVDEDNEVVTLTLSGTVTGTVTGTITDSDVPLVSVGNAEMVEEGGILVFEVTVTPASVNPIELTYTISGDGIENADFMDVPATGEITGTRNIPAGMNSVEIMLRTANDDVDEPNEEVSLTYTGGGSSGTANGTIEDNDVRMASVTGPANAVDEGGTMTFTVNLSGTSSAGRNSVIAYTIGDAVTADQAQPADYADATVPAGTLTFGPTETSKTIDLDILDDMEDELDETIVVTLGVGADMEGIVVVDVAANRATGTISDTDEPVVTVANANTVEEGGTLVFAVTVEPASAVNLTLNYVITGAETSGTPLTGVDFNDPADVMVEVIPATQSMPESERITGSLEIPSGTSTIDIELTTRNDSIDEDHEVVNLTYSGAASGMAMGGIDDDDRPSFDITRVVMANEGENLEFIITLTPAPWDGRTFEYEVLGEGITISDFNDSDLRLVSREVSGSTVEVIVGTIVVPPGASGATLELTTAADNVDEENEVAVVNFFGGLAGGRGEIIDTTVPVIMVANAPAISEGGDLVFEVNVSPVSIIDLTLNYSLEGAGVESADFDDDDLTDVSGTLDIPMGTGTTSIVLTTVNDSVDEANEVVTLRYSGAAEGAAEATVNDDDIRVASVSDVVAVDEGESMTFAVELSGSSSLGRSTVITYVLGGSATRGDSSDPKDYTESTASAGTLTFGPSETRKEVVLNITDDDEDELEETITITLGLGAGLEDQAELESGSDSAHGVINDLDVPDVMIGDADTVEEGTALVFEVTVAPASVVDLVLNYTLSGDGIDANDFRDQDLTDAVGAPDLTGSLTVPAGTERIDIELTTNNDGVNEQQEEVVLTYSSPFEGAAFEGVVRGTINDSDRPTVTVGNAVAVVEGGTLMFEVTVTPVSVTALQLDYELSGDVVAADFNDQDLAGSTGLAGSLTIDPNTATASIELTTADDDIDEADEMVTLEYSNAATGMAEGIINDGDTPVVTVGNAGNVAEGSDLVFRVDVAPTSIENLNLVYVLIGTGVDIDDFDDTDLSVSQSGQIGGTLEIPAGTARMDIVLTTADDNIDETDEEVTLQYSGAASGSVTGTIDDDDTPVVTVGNSDMVSEGGDLEFEVTVMPLSRVPLTLTYTLSGTNLSAADFTDEDLSGPNGLSGSVMIPANISPVFIVLTTTSDGQDEDNEVVTLTYSYPGVTNRTAMGTINDGDNPTVTVEDADTVAEGSDLVFDVTVKPQSRLRLTLNYTLSGTGIDEADFNDTDLSGLTGTLMIEPNTSSAEIVLTTVDDSVNEGFEEVDLIYTGAATGTANGRINDPDTPLVSIGNAPAVTEGGDLEFTVTVVPPSPVDLELTYILSGEGVSTADFNDTDLTGLTGRLMILANTPSIDVVLTTVSGDGDEPNEEVTLTYSGAASGKATGTIVDGDEPVVTVGSADTVAEGGDLVFPVTVSPVSITDLTLDYTLSGTGVTAGDFDDSDLSGRTGSLTILAGTQSTSIGLTTAVDSIDEDSEEVTLTFSGAASGSVTGFINDGDVPVVTVGDATTVAEGDPLVFRVTVDPQSVFPLEITYTLSGENITEGDFADEDLTGLSGALTIPADTPFVDIELTTADDNINEPLETVTLRYEGAAIGTAIGRITDADSPIVSVNNAQSVFEGGDLVFQVTVNPPSRVSLELTFTLSGGAGFEPSDFTDSDLGGSSGLEGSLTIPANRSSIDITLTTATDGTIESDEEVTLTYLVGVFSGTAIGTIFDADTPRVSVGNVQEAVLEGDDLVFEVSVAPQSQEELVLNYTLSGVGVDTSDFDDDDLTGLSGMLAIPSNSDGASIVITTAADNIDEANETVTLTYSGAASGTATGIITDIGDFPEISIADPDSPAAEGSPLEFTVTLSKAVGSTVMVDYLFEGSATNADYNDATEGSGTLTFEVGGSLEQTITLATLEDDLDEPEEEEVTVTLSNPQPVGEVALSLTAASATGVITDGDVPNFTLQLESSRSSQGQQVFDFIVLLEPPSTMSIEVSFELGGEANLDEDYTCAILEFDDSGAEIADAMSSCPIPSASGGEGDASAAARSASVNSGGQPADSTGIEAANSGGAHSRQAGLTGNLVFEPQERRKSIRMTTLPDDDEPEPPESIVVTLADVAPSGAAEIEQNQGTVTASIGISALTKPSRDGAITMLHHHVSRFDTVTSSIAMSRLRGTSSNSLRARGVDGVDSVSGTGRTGSDVSRWSGWGSLTYGSVSGRGDGSAYDVYVGTDTLTSTGNGVLGFLVGYEAGDLEMDDAEYSSSHLQLGVYGAARTSGGTIFDGAIAIGSASPSVAAGAVTADLSTSRMTVRGAISGDVGWGGDQFAIQPTVGLLYASETIDGFMDSNGAAVDEQSLSITRLSAGVRMIGSFGGGEYVLHPQLNYDSESLGDADVDMGVGDEESDESSESTVSSSIQGTVRYNLQSGSILQLTATYNGLGNSSTYQSFTAGFDFSIPF